MKKSEPLREWNPWPPVNKEVTKYMLSLLQAVHPNNILTTRKFKKYKLLMTLNMRN